MKREINRSTEHFYNQIYLYSCSNNIYHCFEMMKAPDQSFINLNLTEILEAASYKHPYDTYYLSGYCLIIFYKFQWCPFTQKNNKNQTNCFFIQGEKQFNDLCMCRGCDLYDDYIQLFSENEWMINNIKAYISLSIPDKEKLYSKKQIERIMQKTYEKLIKESSLVDKRIVLFLFMAINIEKFCGKDEKIAVKEFLEELKKMESIGKKEINQMIEMVGKKIKMKTVTNYLLK